MTLDQNLQADDHDNPQGHMVAEVTVIGALKAHESNLRESSLSVLETIAPSETYLDPELDDGNDPDVTHWGWRDEIEAAWKKRKPFYALCGKLVYIRPKPPNRKHCPACLEAKARIARSRTGRY